MKSDVKQPTWTDVLDAAIACRDSPAYIGQPDLRSKARTPDTIFKSMEGRLHETSLLWVHRHCLGWRDREEWGIKSPCIFLQEMGPSCRDLLLVSQNLLFAEIQVVLDHVFFCSDCGKHQCSTDPLGTLLMRNAVQRAFSKMIHHPRRPVGICTQCQ